MRGYKRYLIRCILRILVVGTLSIAASLSVAAQEPLRLTLEHAIQEGLRHNERIVTQRYTIEQTALDVRLAKNDFQPKLTPNILGSFGQTDVSSQTYRVDLSQKFATGTEVRAGVGTFTSQIPGASGRDINYYNADTTLSVTQPLLRGFGPAVARRGVISAELRRADAERRSTLTEQEVALEIATAYYRVVAHEAFVDVANKSVDRYRRLRDASEAKLGAGLVSQLDVLRAQQLVAQAEIQLFDAQSAVEDARDRLMFLMGRDSDAPVQLPSDIPEYERSDIAVDDAIALAVENRLDLKSLIANDVDAEAQLAFARNQRLPQVDVNFALTRRETADSFRRSFGIDGFQFATFFTISMPVDRTPQLIAYQNALILRERHRSEVATLRRRIVDDVKRAVRERNRLARGFAVAETSVSISRKEVEVAQFRYERGLANNLDVVAAESGLLSAEGRRIQLRADLFLAGLYVRMMTGTLDPRKDFAALAGAGGRTSEAP